jgi:simple sugar transport system substrate-binding protein
MIGRLRTLALTAMALGIALLAAGCGGTGVNALPQQPGLPAIKADPANAPVGAAAGVNVFGLSHKRIRFFVITHGQASDPFWAVVQNGAEAAASQLGVSVTYEAPDTYDISRMREMIRDATATRPAGLVVSLPNPTALAPAIRAAEQAGIPVVSINSGSDGFRRLGTLLHVGEDEYSAGYAAGRRMSARHVRHALCVIHEPGNLDLEQRCRGFAAALAATGAHTSMLDVNLQHTNAAEQRIAASLRGGRFDGLLTLGGAVIAGPTLAALRTDHLLGTITYATFGIGPQVLNALRAGQITFAADQQPYLQGYLPIVLLTQYHLYGVLPDRGRLLSTGPVFITRQNAAHVLELINQGVR